MVDLTADQLKLAFVRPCCGINVDHVSYWRYSSIPAKKKDTIRHIDVCRSLCFDGRLYVSEVTIGNHHVLGFGKCENTPRLRSLAAEKRATCYIPARRLVEIVVNLRRQNTVNGKRLK